MSMKGLLVSFDSFDFTYGNKSSKITRIQTANATHEKFIVHFSYDGQSPVRSYHGAVATTNSRGSTFTSRTGGRSTRENAYKVNEK